MYSQTLKKLLKVILIIVIASILVKVFGWVLALIFGLTVPFMISVLFILVPALAIYGLYKFFTREETW